MNEPYDCEHGNSCYTCKDCTIKELTAQLAEADRRAGEAERKYAYEAESALKRADWFRNAKAQWGSSNNVSFDVIWDECLALKSQLAERDTEIEVKQRELDEYYKTSEICNNLLNENAALRAEVERLKEESSHLWVRIESGEAAAYEQGKAEARKQTAQEIIEEVIGEWNCDCGYGGLVIADAIKARFGLEE